MPEQTAIFGGGCFWCLEAVFQRVQGVTAVESGYAGGHVENPTYRQVCSGATGHAEVVRITFDPQQVSYPELLAVFFAIHDPTTPDRQGNDVGTQYRSVIFYTSEEQRGQAEEAIEALDGEFPDPGSPARPTLARWGGGPIVTEVEPAPEFYPAEPYHQGYYNQNAGQPYCQFVIAPKLKKFEKLFAQKMKA